MYYDQLVKIQFIKSKLEHMQDNIISANYGLLHPSILTIEEIELYSINIERLSWRKLVTATFRNEHLIFVIKIPKIFIEINLIDGKLKKVFKYQNVTFSYEKKLIFYFLFQLPINHK